MPLAAPQRIQHPWWLLVVVLWFWPISSLHAQDSAPISLSAYQGRLAAALAQLDNGVDLEAVQFDIAAITHVELPDGRILDVVPLLEGVDNADDARARLKTALGQLERIDSDRTADRLAALDRASRRLDLDRLNLAERIQRWFDDLLDRIQIRPWQQTAAGSAVGRAVGAVAGWGIVIVGSLLLAVLLSYWLRRLLGGILTDSVAPPRRTESGEPATAAEARKQASTQAQSGDYRQAVRSLFLSALLHLREGGLLHYADSQTNRELLASLPPQSPARPHLEPVVETFDQVWYGIREPDEQTFNAYCREVNALMTETDNHSFQ